MIRGFNTAPVALLPRPHQVACDDYVSEMVGCECHPRARNNAVIYAVGHESRIEMYSGGDAVSVKAPGCGVYGPASCGQLSPADATGRIFIDDGNVFVEVREGRTNQLSKFSASITDANGRTFGRNVTVESVL